MKRGLLALAFACAGYITAETQNSYQHQIRDLEKEIEVISARAEHQHIRAQAAYYNLYADHRELQEQYQRTIDEKRKLHKIGRDFIFVLIKQNKVLEERLK